MPCAHAATSRGCRRELEQRRRILRHGRLRPLRLGRLRASTLACMAVEPVLAALRHRRARRALAGRGRPAMKPRQKRLADRRRRSSAAVGVAAALVLNAFQSNLVFFYSPSQVAAHEAPSARTLPPRRPGREGQRSSATARKASFVVTDTAKSIAGAATRASFPTCSRKARASSPRASCRAACSSPARCSPSTTRTTCRPKPPRR